MRVLLAVVIVLAQDSEPSGVDRIRLDAVALKPSVRSSLARQFLDAATSLPKMRTRTLYHDPANKTYRTQQAAEKLDANSRERLKEFLVDETFYYNTRFGSPLAYARPLELLGRSGIETLSGRKVLDFGCGGLGPLRLMASCGAEVVGVDVDPMLEALYSEPGDLGAVEKGRLSLFIGRYPLDETMNAKVGREYDLVLSKNTLKRGYVHPESGRTFIDLGVSDEAFLATLFASLKPAGRVMIFNLGPAPNSPDQPYKPMADCRSPFARLAWERAGFLVEAFDRDDTPAARELGALLGWNKGEGAMDLEKDLFATYTLVRKP
jgi:SAM-dependent methyltransferase